MVKKLIPILSLAGVLAAQTPAPKPAAPVKVPAPAGPASAKKSALSKADLEAYVRHLFVWPEGITVDIKDQKPGPMPGYYEVSVRGISGAQMQDEKFYISYDGQRIIRGLVYDIAANPFKPELDKIKTEGQPAFGTPGAPVVIAEFSDYECPYCREQSKSLRDNLLKAFPTEVRLYYFDYPLEQIHPWARPAARAGRCVFKQSASTYWDFHDWIFDKQADINADNLTAKVLEFAKTKSDLDAAQLNSCIESKDTEKEVDRSQLIGQSLSVNQTPTIFVNGRRLGGVSSWPDLKYVIDFEIGYQKTAKNAGEDCGCDVRLPTFGGAAPDAKPGSLQSAPAKKK